MTLGRMHFYYCKIWPGLDFIARATVIKSHTQQKKIQLKAISPGKISRCIKRKLEDDLLHLLFACTQSVLNFVEEGDWKCIGELWG